MGLEPVGLSAVSGNQDTAVEVGCGGPRLVGNDIACVRVMVVFVFRGTHIRLSKTLVRTALHLGKDECYASLPPDRMVRTPKTARSIFKIRSEPLRQRGPTVNSPFRSGFYSLHMPQ